MNVQCPHCGAWLAVDSAGLKRCLGCGGVFQVGPQPPPIQQPFMPVAVHTPFRPTPRRNSSAGTLFAVLAFGMLALIAVPCLLIVGTGIARNAADEDSRTISAPVQFTWKFTQKELGASKELYRVAVTGPVTSRHFAAVHRKVVSSPEFNSAHRIGNEVQINYYINGKSEADAYYMGLGLADPKIIADTDGFFWLVDKVPPGIPTVN